MFFYSTIQSLAVRSKFIIIYTYHHINISPYHNNFLIRFNGQNLKIFILGENQVKNHTPQLIGVYKRMQTNNIRYFYIIFSLEKNQKKRPADRDQIRFF
jgi:hypothetical protein